jgi:hypothetical protein
MKAGFSIWRISSLRDWLLLWPEFGDSMSFGKRISRINGVIWRCSISFVFAFVLVVTTAKMLQATDAAPTIVDHTPKAFDSSISLYPEISVTWSQPMSFDSSFVVSGPEGPVSGDFTYDPDSFTVRFTPDSRLDQETRYEITVENQVDATGRSQLKAIKWTFHTVAPKKVSIAQFSSKHNIKQNWWWTAWPSMMILISLISLIGFVIIWEKRSDVANKRLG